MTGSLFLLRTLTFLKFLKYEHFFRLRANFHADLICTVWRHFQQLDYFLSLRSSIFISFSRIFEFIWSTIWIQIYQICRKSQIGLLNLNLLMRLRRNIIFIQFENWNLRLVRVLWRSVFHLDEIDALGHLRWTFLHQSNRLNRPIRLINPTCTAWTMRDITFRCNWRPTLPLQNLNFLLQRQIYLFSHHRAMCIFQTRRKTWRRLRVKYARFELITSWFGTSTCCLIT